MYLCSPLSPWKSEQVTRKALRWEQCENHVSDMWIQLGSELCRVSHFLFLECGDVMTSGPVTGSVGMTCLWYRLQVQWGEVNSEPSRLESQARIHSTDSAEEEVAAWRGSHKLQAQETSHPTQTTQITSLGGRRLNFSPLRETAQGKN